uniref:Allantoate amidinohydrolase n=1 Tax=Amphilophus citrinellus TaxID=61819 RepID=A0A3Q0T837_AMPCI
MAERRTAGKEAAEPDFLQFNDLVCETVGGKVIFATDEWFAPAKNLLKREPPQFIASAFTEFGKWMDGWETRRKRTPHDWCIIQLGVPGLIYGLDVDTSFFTGNHSPYVSIQASCLQVPPFTPEGDRTGMAASDGQMAAVAKDGGIARLRVYGVGQRDWLCVSINQDVDLVALTNGGVCLGYSDAHFGHPRNMILGRAANMADGWETARRLDRPRKLQADQRGILQVPGWEWAVFRLGHPGLISSVEVDTNHFKNFPDSCRIEACTLTPEQEAQCIRNRWNSGKWQVLFPPQKLQPHHRHHYGKAELKVSHPVTHIRLIIAPDGGVSRLRLWGRPTPITAVLANQRSPASKL